jgi:hypothetical protein
VIDSSRSAYSAVPGVDGAAAVVGQKGAQAGDVVAEQVWVCTAPWLAGHGWPSFDACCVTVYVDHCTPPPTCRQPHTRKRSQHLSCAMSGRLIYTDALSKLAASVQHASGTQLDVAAGSISFEAVKVS